MPSKLSRVYESQIDFKIGKIRAIPLETFCEAFVFRSN